MGLEARGVSRDPKRLGLSSWDPVPPETSAAPSSVACCAPEQEKLLWLKGGGSRVPSSPAPRSLSCGLSALQQPPILRNFPAENDGSERSGVLAPSSALLLAS